MLTCPYCATELLPKAQVQLYRCRFCEMDVGEKEAQKNGQRKQVDASLHMLDHWARKTTPELKALSTLNLIYLLRHVRGQRGSLYNNVRLFNKAGDTDPDLAATYEEAAQSSGELYEYWTRKAWVIENILRERTGDFPAKITDKYLLELLERVKEINAKTMTISKSRGKRIERDKQSVGR